MAVVAPTGVAAINAGGMTIHSFFQLPFGPFIPSAPQGWGSTTGIANNKHSLLKNLRLNSNRRQLIQELELVVIDEVSMVRADMLDAIDLVLRHVRRKQHLPFGGVQMIYIGDLFQLPPVASKEEWSILAEYYSSPFFFDAQVIKEANPLFLELTHIYRQRDEHFIALLEKIRNNNPSAQDLELLHQHYEPGFIPAKEENYITLTTHNYKADAINKRALEELPGIERKRWQLEHSWKIAEGLLAKTPVTQILESMTVKPVVMLAQPKSKVGETRFVSLELFRQQLSISAIAARRGMTESTIETHLASFMESGEIRVYDLMSEQTVDIIVTAFGKNPGQGLATIKQQLDPAITYNQLRIVRQYLDLLRKQSTISS